MEQIPQSIVKAEPEPEFAAFIAIDWADQKHYWSPKWPGRKASNAGLWTTLRKRWKCGLWSCRCVSGAGRYTRHPRPCPAGFGSLPGGGLGTDCAGSVTQGLRRTGARVYGFEFPARAERDRTAVRRPEREERAFGPDSRGAHG